MRKTWQIKQQDLLVQRLLTEELSISPIMAQILINRSIRTPKEADFFLNPSLLNLHDPMLMKGMKESVSRIKQAIQKKEKILIYGDYDVDGISAAALLILTLKRLGTDVASYIPNRLDDGYGLNEKAVSIIHKKGIELLITVDCGITAISEIKSLRELGIGTIVTDHHRPDEKLPDADIILNPLQEGCPYPDKNLAGVGVAFKLAAGLLGKDDDWLYQQLDLVCLGTIADVVPLIGENRILVKNGLNELTHTKKQGLKALIEQTSLKGKDITSHYVGYILGPRINATGRLGSPYTSLNLLLTDDYDKAKELAKMLGVENKNRQKMEELVLKQAMAKVERDIDFKRHRVIVLEDESWHKGVIGIVASRLVDKFYRPTVIISIDGNEGRGSCRSIRNFNLFDALSDCSQYLKNYGGHSYAAGLTIQKNRLDDFRQTINDIANKRILPQDLIPCLNIDAEMPISALNQKLLKELDGLSPFGSGNPRPVFVSRNLKIRNIPQTLRRSTIKMWVTDGKVTAEAIGFNMADFMPSDPLNQKIDIAYTYDLNVYKGITSIKLQLKDLHVCTACRRSDFLSGNCSRFERDTVPSGNL
ncbi:single-stranded-DNA-specific exonuclease RecJ [bacterium]|nr:MAG: single-stranded-DNA-specific exonuclease RecJ [bacterium]